ncbi:uncharacterized protein N7483_006206 [Penicillium malachiteum]|uniref:uncharacterized protein n=1 Tax=Penicillium malachiteum TaxID=1324776 RepID=UPI002547381A|nr:uncharacterized protein N7483_006206 [Penicillium malachiteum]KAJ5731698.1 hypothetical protein N7483_006206 [Penicillium malachiteum]
MSDKPITADPEFNTDNSAPGDYQSETTSIASSTYRGLIEDGRRYQTMRENKSWSPADEQQFESLEAGHAVAIVMDSDKPNPLFQAPVTKPLRNILDLGTGNGLWAIDVADMLPEATVRGVDLFPPPAALVPPNYILEVDDVLEEWTWREPFDLIHLRIMLGSFDVAEWKQLELDAHLETDDGSLSQDSLAATWGDNTFGCAERADRRIDTLNTMRASIEQAGFIDVHEKNYKWPIGAWAREKHFKEAGALNYNMWSSGIEALEEEGLGSETSWRRYFLGTASI